MGLGFFFGSFHNWELFIKEACINLLMAAASRTPLYWGHRDFNLGFLSTNTKEWTHECRFSVQVLRRSEQTSPISQLKLELDLKSHLFWYKLFCSLLPPHTHPASVLIKQYTFPSSPKSSLARSCKSDILPASHVFNLPFVLQWGSFNLYPLRQQHVQTAPPPPCIIPRAMQRLARRLSRHLTGLCYLSAFS